MQTILAVDIGGTNVKALATGHEEVRKFPSGPELTPAKMVEGVLNLTQDWQYDVVSIGYPGPVVNNKASLEPKNLASGWVGFDFAARFERPVKMINDAAMQALGSYEGGRMLFLGLGTGLGSALIVERVIAPLELAHLPYKKGGTFEDYVGVRGLKRLGKKKWQKAVDDVVTRLKAALVADYVVLGGGNARKLDELPSGARLGDNRHAFLGGFRLWEA
jgi:polyphosphate glucokinase